MSIIQRVSIISINTKSRSAGGRSATPSDFLLSAFGCGGVVTSRGVFPHSLRHEGVSSLQSHQSAVRIASVVLKTQPTSPPWYDPRFVCLNTNAVPCIVARRRGAPGV